MPKIQNFQISKKLRRNLKISMDEDDEEDLLLLLENEEDEEKVIVDDRKF